MSSKTPAHRELIDMVMAVKDSGKISQLDHVSKTKVRGVLALLKHGELLITQGEEGEPVRLYLAQGIGSFKDLRERHDSFLNRYITEHKIFIPVILKSELIWQFDEATKLSRIDAIGKIIVQLQGFYANYSQQGAGSEVSSSVQPDYRHSLNASPVFDGIALVESAGSPRQKAFGDYSQSPYGSDTTQVEQLSANFSRVGVNATPSLVSADWLYSSTPRVAASNQVSRQSNEADGYNSACSPSSFRDKTATPQTSTSNSHQMYIPFTIPYRLSNPNGQVPIKSVIPTPSTVKYQHPSDLFDNNIPGGSNMYSTSQHHYAGSPSPPAGTGFQYSQHSSAGQAMYDWRDSSPSREIKKPTSMFVPSTNGSFPMAMIQRSSPVTDSVNNNSQIWFRPLGDAQFTRDDASPKLEFNSFGINDSGDHAKADDSNLMKNFSRSTSPETFMSVPSRPPLSGGNRSVSSSSFKYVHGNTVLKPQEVDYVSRLDNNSSFFSENASSLFQKTSGDAFEKVIVPRTVSSPFQLPAFGNHNSNATSLTSTPMRPSFDNDDATSRRSTSRSYSPYAFQSLAAISMHDSNHNPFATRNSTPVMTMQGLGVADVEQGSPKQSLQFFEGQFHDSRPSMYLAGQESFQQLNQVQSKPQYQQQDQQQLLPLQPQLTQQFSHHQQFQQQQQQQQPQQQHAHHPQWAPFGASDIAQYPHLSCNSNTIATDSNRIEVSNVIGAQRNLFVDQGSMLDDIASLPFEIPSLSFK